MREQLNFETIEPFAKLTLLFEIPDHLKDKNLCRVHTARRRRSVKLLNSFQTRLGSLEKKGNDVETCAWNLRLAPIDKRLCKYACGHGPIIFYYWSMHVGVYIIHSNPTDQ